MIRANDPVYPLEAGRLYPSSSSGLTKREYFAAMALQGLMASDAEQNFLCEDAAEIAVEQADALIAELEKEAQ